LRYPYRQLGDDLDRNYRNALNQNLIDIENDLRDIATAPEQALLAADEAETQALYAQEQGDFANAEGTFASEQGLFAQTQGQFAKDNADLNLNFKMMDAYMPGNTYKERNMVTYQGTLWMAIQDVPIMTFPTDSAYWRAVSNETTVNTQLWTATEGQTVFNITNGSYAMGENHLEVWVGNIPQIKNQGFTETSDTSFTLSEGVPAGEQVRARWFEGAITISLGHKNTHAEGGNDEINVVDLAGYKENIEDKLKKTEGILNVSEYGILSDGTDQTTALTTLFTGELSTFRGFVTIPYGTKFDILTVYDSLPSGIAIMDNSGVNYSDSAGYKNKVIQIGSMDKTADDTNFSIVSGHHPALILNNLGIAEDSPGVLTPSAAMKRASILFANGFKPSSKSPLTTFLMQSAKHPTESKWIWHIRTQHKNGDPNTLVDSTMFALDEDGKLGLGDFPDIYNLRVIEKNSNITRLAIENTVVGSDVYLTFLSKDTGGGQKKAYIRLDKNGVLSFRDSTNTNMLQMLSNGTIDCAKGINGGAFTTANRPTGAPIGTHVFDTTLGKPIWLKSAGVWVDSTGTVV
jgi:hypothetical protein